VRLPTALGCPFDGRGDLGVWPFLRQLSDKAIRSTGNRLTPYPFPPANECFRLGQLIAGLTEVGIQLADRLLQLLANQVVRLKASDRNPVVPNGERYIMPRPASRA